MKIKRIHIGQVVRSKVEERGMSKAQFARMLGIQRQNIEKTVFNKHSLDSDLMCAISEILDCNLFNYFSDCNKKNYTQELKAKLTIELGEETKDKTFKFVFGSNNIEIIEK